MVFFTCVACASRFAGLGMMTNFKAAKTEFLLLHKLDSLLDWFFDELSTLVLAEQTLAVCLFTCTCGEGLDTNVAFLMSLIVVLLA